MRARLLVPLLLLAPVDTNAASVPFGVGARFVATDCNGPSGLDCTDPNLATQVNGFLGSGGSNAAVAPGNSATAWGTTLASAQLVGLGALPVLRTSAASTTSGDVAADAWAVQSFTYVGTSPTTRTFTGTLTLSQSGGGALAGPAWGQTRAVFGLYSGLLDDPSSSFESFLVDTRVTTDVCARFDPTLCLGAQRLSLVLPENGSSRTISVGVALSPGDVVTVFSWTQSWSAGGGFSDAANTFVTSVDVLTDLVPAGTAVPEPSLPSLAALAWAALRLARRRHGAKV